MIRRRTLLEENGVPVKEGCLMFTASEDGTFSFTKDGLSYSTDGTTWTALAANAATPTIAAGNTIYFKGTMTPGSSSGIGTFSSTGNFTASGTPMSLLFGDDFDGKTSLSGKSYAFRELFKNCTKLTSIDDLLLPATTLASYCYSYMFYGCTGLTSIPSTLLPATALADYCYYYMFSGCTGLTSIPSTLLPATTLATACYESMFGNCTKLTTIPSTLLPATTLKTYCYHTMFSGCTNITTAPDLPATTLVNSCYYEMFNNCTKLNSIRMLATNISATLCLSGWVRGVASSGTFYKNPSATIYTGISGIPSGWTAIGDYLRFTATSSGTFQFTKAGLSYSTNGTTWTELAANTNTPTIAAGSKIYFRGTPTPSTSSPYGIGTFSSTGNFTVSGNIMSLLYGNNFDGQTNLSEKTYAFYELFKSCTKLKSIDGLLLPATTLSSNCYRYMFQGCTGLTSIPTNFLPATTLATYCYYAMFYQCSGLTTIPKDLLPATTLATYCYYAMFRGCTNITASPNLTAGTLTNYSYAYMFYGCSELNSIRMLATDISATSCLSTWVTNVASSGTFYKKSGATIPSGTSGIPSGWTVVNV